MKIWVIFDPDGDFLEAFSTKENAETYAAEYPAYSDAMDEIIEYELDPIS